MTVNSTFTAGQVLTAAQMNNLPFGVVERASNTTLSQNVTTLTDLTSMSVTFTGVANRLYRIEGRVLLKSNEAGNAVSLIIRDGSNTILNLDIISCATVNQDFGAYISHFMTVTGSYTVKLTCQRQTGSGTITASSAATFPAQLLVTDLGTV
jgi:hypothetical protein